MTILWKDRYIKRRSLKYRCHSKRFISNGTWNSSHTDKPVVITTSPSDWSGWGNLKNLYMEYKLTCFKIEMLPKQPAGLPKLQSEHSTHLPTMCSRYCDRPLSTTTSLEQNQDVRKTLMNRYKKWIIKYPKYNWNNSTWNLCISKTRWLPTSSSQGFYGIAFQTDKDLTNLFDIKLTSYVKMKSPINDPSNDTITVLNMPNMKLQKRDAAAGGGGTQRTKDQTLSPRCIYYRIIVNFTWSKFRPCVNHTITFSFYMVHFYIRIIRRIKTCIIYILGIFSVYIFATRFTETGKLTFKFPGCTSNFLRCTNSSMAFWKGPTTFHTGVAKFNIHCLFSFDIKMIMRLEYVC